MPSGGTTIGKQRILQRIRLNIRERRADDGAKFRTASAPTAPAARAAAAEVVPGKQHLGA